ncbi:unnamed protein product [Miscanthus lutarioriparius]|uniref:Uncharacterized protein n=1 Tax=Miscanthus lutarioriparius TaxID=422564 RepID=A0A811R924_9POAL|nr:unnamed protein product [Miscanthus lutarioriparius]
MANVLKLANRAEEAIEAIRSFSDQCPYEAQESLDNILLDLYKKCGRTDEQIEMLTIKLRIVDEELASGRWKTKLSKSHGRVVYLSLRDEKARLLGNLAWAYMQSENYEEAEMLYRQALAIEADYNKECNLAICLMKTGKLAEAKYLIQAIPYNCDDESHVKSLSRATEMLRELDLQSLLLEYVRHSRTSVAPASSGSDDASDVGDPVGLDPAILWHGAAHRRHRPRLLGSRGSKTSFAKEVLSPRPAAPPPAAVRHPLQSSFSSAAGSTASLAGSTSATGGCFWPCCSKEKPQTLSTPLSELKYKEPHISVSQNADKHENCNSGLPSPITQLRREEPHTMVTAGAEKNEGFAEFQDLSRLFNDAATHSILEKLRKRLVKEAQKTSIHDQIQTPTPTECLPNSERNLDASETPMQEGKLLTKGVRETLADMVDEEEQQLGDDKPWADMVVKDEQQLGDGKSTLGVGTTKQNGSSKHASKLEYRTPLSCQESRAHQRPVMGGQLHGSSAGSWRQNDSKISMDKNVNRDLVRTAPTWSKHKEQAMESTAVCKWTQVVYTLEPDGFHYCSWSGCPNMVVVLPQGQQWLAGWPAALSFICNLDLGPKAEGDYYMGNCSTGSIMPCGQPSSSVISWTDFNAYTDTVYALYIYD